MLNKTSGNMYSFCTHTWNVLKGKCEFDCKYCYMKRFPQKEIRFDEKEFKTDLGKGNFIFIGSSCDMFAPSIPYEQVCKILEYADYFDNKYLLQTKNPERYLEFIDVFPQKVVLGVTIETNCLTDTISKAPNTMSRVAWMQSEYLKDFGKMVTVEPILAFNLKLLVSFIKRCNSKWVNIGADSQKSNLPEPSAEQVRELIAELEKFTTVKIKTNLKRILKN